MEQELSASNHQLSASDRQAALGFSYFQKIGTKRWQCLENYFPNLTTAFNASLKDLVEAGLSAQIAQDFIGWRPSFSIETVIKELIQENINYCVWSDDNYPNQLKNIPDAPPLLYYKGDISCLTNNSGADCLAVVGSRQNSLYGAKAITTIIPALVQSGIKIISGLALGIDALAHQATLDNNGQTAAILGSGLNSQYLYPTQNRLLANNIIRQGGVLISELPPNTPPYKQNFPRRNRLISGLAKATLIIEATNKSGALLTAEYAKKQNRAVLVIPGSIFSNFSQGTNNLIISGGEAVTSANDILKKLGLASNPIISSDQLIDSDKRNNERNNNCLISPKNPIEKVIYELIKGASEQSEIISVDRIIQTSKLDTATINSKLSILELNGLIRLTGNGYELNI